MGTQEVREALERARCKRDLSLADVAALAGIGSTATVWRVLRNDGGELPESAAKVARVLGYELVQQQPPPKTYVLKPRRVRRAK